MPSLLASVAPAPAAALAAEFVVSAVVAAAVVGVVVVAAEALAPVEGEPFPGVSLTAASCPFFAVVSVCSWAVREWKQEN